MNKQTFTIPEGCKAISMEIIDNAIVTTFEQHEFKKGDFVKFIHSKNIIILSKDVYDKKSEGGCFPYKSCFIKIRTDGSLDWDGGTDVIIAVTNEEKQFAIDALAKENKAWDAEKMEIVELKYIPKVGDCVKCALEKHGEFYFVYDGNRNSKGCYIKIYDGVLEIKKYTSIKFTIELIETASKITPEELQAEFNKLGYEYDFLMHDAKKLKWVPKLHENYYYLDDKGIMIYSEWEDMIIDVNRYNLKNCFKTEAEAQKFKEYILAYDPQKNN